MVCLADRSGPLKRKTGKQFCKTKRKYIDAIYFNSRLDNNVNDADLEEMASYSSDRANMDYVMGDGGITHMLEKNSRNREVSPDYVIDRLKNSIDNAIENPYIMEQEFDYINNFAGSPSIEQDEISVDSIADEYMNDVHEYGAVDKQGVDHFDDDDPDKVAKEADEKRDTSNDPKPSKFAMSFGWC